MIRDITLGQYFFGNSVIHRLDARTKIICLFVFIILLFGSINFVSLFLTVAACLAVIIMTKINFIFYLKSMKVILFVIILTGVINLFYGSGKVLFEWGIIIITEGGISTALFVCIRLSALMLISSVLTYTTTPTDLTYAMERLMSPLKILRIKPHEIALMMSVALRFIPVLLIESDRIMNAQKSRGADMESGNLFKRVRSFIPVIIPLFVSSIRHANDLAIAMECRCYNGSEGRTRMRVQRFKLFDFVAFLFTAFVTAGVVLLGILF